MSSVDMRCPKCGSHAVERMRNQECRCRKCGAVFFFVTPNTGAIDDFDRYQL